MMIDQERYLNTFATQKGFLPTGQDQIVDRKRVAYTIVMDICALTGLVISRTVFNAF